MNSEPLFGVSDFVAVLNQTLEFAYPSVSIVGELANLRVSKGRWVYFDLKDESSSVKFFGTVQQLPGPLEEGMMLQVRGMPRLHNLYGFSVNVQFMQPVGEGSIKKAAALLEAKLTAEGLFDPLRKRPLPYPPRRIGLITSGESAAYRDFVKVLDGRWGGVEILHADVQVQGEPAISQIVQAIAYFNTHSEAVDVLIITRGGGSADDLAAFSTEQVTRAVAASRIPTLVAIGHEVDVSLAELAADVRASTPSNAAELLVPDRKAEGERIVNVRRALFDEVSACYKSQQKELARTAEDFAQRIQALFDRSSNRIKEYRSLLEALSPAFILTRGYAIVRDGSRVVRSASGINRGDVISIEFADGSKKAEVQ